MKATEQYGADVLRLYVASMDYSDDIRISERGIKEMSEAYRKIRNTFRYLLGNLEDYKSFEPESVPAQTLHEIDRWALGQLNSVIRDVRASYAAFEFYKVYQRIYQFCSVTLSSLYLDVLKDRLYAEDPLGPHRRAAQFVLAKLHRDLVRLLAPLIPHTAEELWDFLPVANKLSSVHLSEWPEAEPVWDNPERDAKWIQLLRIRDLVLIVLEGMRANKVIGSSQAASVSIACFKPGQAQEFEAYKSLLTELCNVSEITIIDKSAMGAGFGSESESYGAVVSADKSPYDKCERCWNLRATVGQNAVHPTLCERCVGVVNTSNSQL